MDEVGYSRPTRLAACKYISRLFHHWCDLILLDHTFGPPQGTTLDSTLPRARARAHALAHRVVCAGCEELLGTVFRRLFRVYGHVYYSHLRKIVARRKEAELNRYFKRLVLFAWHHKVHGALPNIAVVSVFFIRASHSPTHPLTPTLRS
jgi:hypothetical protein